MWSVGITWEISSLCICICINLLKWFCSVETCALHRKYLTYLDKIHTTVFTPLSTSSDPNLFFVTPSLLKLAYLATRFILQQTHTARNVVSWRINNIVKWANSANNGAREMEFGSHDGGEDGEHNGAGFVEISNILMMQDSFFFWYNIVWRRRYTWFIVYRIDVSSLSIPILTTTNRWL